MFNLFRQIRFNLVEIGKTGKYLKYALGEIFLVVIGILIALQVNNWNEARKDKKEELAFFYELKEALEFDSFLISRAFEPRMDQKEKAIDSLKLWMSTGMHYDAEEFMRLYEKSQTKIGYRYNVGPYESLKSKGLDLIKNADLRSYITNLYEVTFPGYKSFIEVVVEKNTPLIRTLEQDFLDIQLKPIDAENYGLFDYPIDQEVLSHPSFRRVLFYEDEIARNYRRRINDIKEFRSEVFRRVQEEIRKKTN